MNWIKSKIIRLPSNEVENNGQLFLDTRTSKHQLVYSDTSISTGTRQKGVEPQHLYFTSNEEIKEGDWRYCEIDKSIGICTDPSYCNAQDYIKKIIATTDPKLLTSICLICKGKGRINPYNDYMEGNCPNCDGTGGYRKLLPKPSQDLIKEYCDAGGIDEVMVEIENKCPCACTSSKIEGCNGDVFNCDGKFNKVKINTDNTINICKIKDSWSREEVIALIKKSKTDFPLHRGVQLLESELSKWIEENL